MNSRFKHIAVCSVIGILLGFLIWTKMHEGLQPIRSDVDINNQILRLNKGVALLEQKEISPSVSKSWEALQGVVSTYGLELTPLNQAEAAEKNLYGGGVKSFHGKINGDVKSLLTALFVLEHQIPVQFFGFRIVNQEMEIFISVLGS